MAKGLSSIEVEELAAHLCGHQFEDDYDLEEVEEKMMEKYNIDLSYFQDLMNDIYPLIDMAVSPLSEEPFIGLGTGKIWIAKRPHESFINSVLQWMNAADIKRGEVNGYEKVITNAGKPEFKIILIKADQKFKIEKEVKNG